MKEGQSQQPPKTELQEFEQILEDLGINPDQPNPRTRPEAVASAKKFITRIKENLNRITPN